MRHHRRSHLRAKTAAAVTALVVTSTGMGTLSAANAETATGPGRGGQIVCPSVGGRLGQVPGAAQQEVTSNLAQLENQIAEANRRLANSAGEGGPNFVQNAILGPLRDKRIAVIERINIAIARAGGQRPQGLEQLAGCNVSGGNQGNQGQGNQGQGNQGQGNGNQGNGQGQNNNGQNNNGQNNNNQGNQGQGNQGQGNQGNGQTIVCPPVANAVGQVPARAQNEVNRNLALLDTQVAEANRRLANSVGQGGPNFVQNAILGPLRDKRVATLERIAIAIGRAGGNRPQGLNQLATCRLGNGNGQGNNQGNGNQGNGRNIVCPPVTGRLGQIPGRAQNEVQRNLNLLDQQVADANRRLANSAGQGGPNFVRNAILGPLRAKRVATLERISIAIARAGGQRPQGLFQLASCSLGNGNNNDNGNNGNGDPAAPPTQNPDQGNNNGNDGNNGNNNGNNGNNGNDGNNNGNNNNGNNGNGDNGNGGQQTGPVPSDFVDIRTVRPNFVRPRLQRNASTGTFTSRCGRNENRHFNSDNVIVAPGVSNGAHHVHDYVGNLDTSGQSTNESLDAAGTTCTNGDKSAYFWPVLRRIGTQEFDANQPGGGLDGNVGKILRPTSVTLTFRGNATSKVVAAPKFLRIITGDAKSFTNGTANANSSWTCTGFENRRLEDKYPLCPRGSQVVRIFEFQSCWDGQNTDSANHRSHVAFVQNDGSCPEGFQAIPALEQRITYAVPPGPSFAVDSFPEQLHKPITDHSDFINVMSEQLMNRAVQCINTGRRCG